MARTLGSWLTRSIALVVTTTGLWAGEASAAEPTLLYVAPSGCPTAGEFDALVKGRLRDGARHAGPALIAGIDSSSAGFRGVLMVRAPSGGVTSREVTAPVCSEVALALALVASMLLDELESAGPPAASTPAAPGPPWRWALQAGVAAQDGIAPRFLYGPQLSAELRRPDSAGLPVVLSLAATYLTGGRSTIDEATSADFSAALAQVQACLRPPTRQGPLQMDVCVGGQVGRVATRLVRSGPDSTTGRTWGAAQAGVGGTIALGRSLSLRPHLGLVAPFTRDSYAVRGPVQVIHRVPGVSLEGGISLGYALP